MYHAFMWEVKIHEHSVRKKKYSGLAQADATGVVFRRVICTEQNSVTVPPN